MSLSYPTRPVLNTSSPATEVSWPKENPFILVPSSKIRCAVWACGREKSRWWANTHPRIIHSLAGGDQILGKKYSVENNQGGQTGAGCTTIANFFHWCVCTHPQKSKKKEKCANTQPCVALFYFSMLRLLQAWGSQTKNKKQKRENNFGITFQDKTFSMWRRLFKHPCSVYPTKHLNNIKNALYLYLHGKCNQIKSRSKT